MQLIDGRLVYSATDLVGFLECRHLTNLERAAIGGHLSRPERDDPVLDRIAKRGEEHEARFLESLRADAVSVIEIESEDSHPFSERVKDAAEATLNAMRSGADVIYQAALFDGRRLGFADFLRRVDRASEFGSWSYEVWDTKLARHAKASAVLQLSVYSEMVGRLQGREPEQMHLALGGVQRETVSFRVVDYAAYQRSVARELELELAASDGSFPLSTKPEPVEHCDVCRWKLNCRAEWRADDDLSLVANITSKQRRALLNAGIATRTGLAEVDPLPDRLDGVSRQSLARIRAQADIQLRGERAGEVISERVPPTRDRDGALVSNLGLLMLPEPSPGDLFFDIEGDPFFGTEEVDGIEYLFGVVEPGRSGSDGAPAFHAFWAIEDGTVTTAAERRVFESFIDLVTDRLAVDPGLHVYHYAPYEPTAVKRLAGRYGTREEEVDQLLRGGVFVDLYRAVRQGIRASVESYSIKRLEPLYGFEREIDLRDADTSIVEFETWLELGDGGQRSELLEQIEGYNRDDCVSTLRLRDWLEAERATLADELGEDLRRPAVVAPEEVEDSDAQKAVQQLVESLTADLSDDLEEACDDQRGRWLLAQLLNWHRRENKSFWWRYFFLRNELTDEERTEESDALGELQYENSWPDPTPRARSTIYRFRFPAQEHKITLGDSPRDPVTDAAAGTVVHIDDEAGVVDLKLGSGRPAPQPTSLIPFDYVGAQPKPESLQRLASSVVESGMDAPGTNRAARELLMRRHPRTGQAAGAPLAADGEEVGTAARRLVLALDESYLAIQGPPGSGKSVLGAAMVVELVRAGRRVGVTANSHKVIGELLEKISEEAGERGVPVAIGQRANDRPTFADALSLRTNAAAWDALEDGSVNVVGGTSWLWAREDMKNKVDVLFIDEAGQMSLADAIAAAGCARNLVLLGDPQQLDQPLQGTHPPGAERSALAHVLDGERVMPDSLGLFLDGTWRLHPEIAAFTSEVFYEGRLHSHPDRERLWLEGQAPLSGAGIRFVPVQHEGRSNQSPEEATAIASQIEQLLVANPTWTDAHGTVRPITEAEILVITPYNAQVAALSAEIPSVRVGTVDKFQGQQAPISIYSMATSSPEEAPRGMEFLYSLNRLNVATSRAQCVAVVVASSALTRVRCRTPRQMRLANALVRLIEVGSDPVR